MNSPTPATNPNSVGITLGIATLALLAAAWLCGSLLPIAWANKPWALPTSG